MTDLDRALAESQKDQSKSDGFYNLFLNMDVFVPTHNPVITNQSRMRRTEEGETFSPIVIENENIPFLPIFSTLDRLQSWAKGQEITYVQMPAHALLRSSLDPKLHLALNVGTPHFKEFTPDEIDWLCQVFEGQKPSAFNVPKGTQVLIGAPSQIPNGLTDSLSTCIKRNTEINTAYLGQVHFQLEGETPQLFLVLKVDQEGLEHMQNINEDIGIAVRGYLPEGQSITMQIYDGTGISADVVDTIKPFYIRK
jgi:hypothetical protein